MALSPRYRCSPQVDISTVATRVVLYHRVSRKAVVLNPTGSTLWKWLESPHTEQALADRLAAAYPSLPPGQPLADTSAFLQSLLAEGLLDVTE
jgi:hypothetical protein